MGVSRPSYAELRGVSEAAVRKAIATGRITDLLDGTIDPARADSKWGAETDPAKQRSQHAKQMGAETAPGTARAAATKPVPQAAIRAVADTLRDAGTDPRSPEATGGEVSFLRARMANELLMAQTAKARPEKAEVIDQARGNSDGVRSGVAGARCLSGLAATGCGIAESCNERNLNAQAGSRARQGKAETVPYVCKHFDAPIAERQKTRMIAEENGRMAGNCSTWGSGGGKGGWGGRKPRFGALFAAGMLVLGGDCPRLGMLAAQ